MLDDSVRPFERVNRELVKRVEAVDGFGPLADIDAAEFRELARGASQSESFEALPQRHRELIELAESAKEKAEERLEASNDIS